MIKKIIYVRGYCMRSLFYTATLILWIVSFVLALEMFALVFQLRMEENNPFICAFKNKEVLPVEPCLSRENSGTKRSWPMPADDVWYGHSVLPNDDTSMQEVLDWGVIDVNSPAEEKKEREKKFLSLTPVAREAYAQLNGVMVFKIGGRYRIHEVYGPYKDYFNKYFRAFLRVFISRSSSMLTLREIIAETLKDGLFHDSVFADEEGNAHAISCIPCEDTEKSENAVYLFVDIHPETITDVGVNELPKDSKWELPGYRFKANYHAPDGNYDTNAFELRDNAITLPKPEGVFRIVCVGGSTTEEGPSNDKTYPKLLEQYLNAAFPDDQIEVINAGTPGAYLHVHLLRFNQYMALEPDLIILHVGVNNLVRQYLRLFVNFIPRYSRFVRLFLPSSFAPSYTNFIKQQYDYMGFPLELFTILAERRGVKVMYASIAFPDYENISKNARKYYEYSANSSWHFPAFSLPVYDEYINISNHLLKRLS